MAFTLKNFTSVAASLINYFRTNQMAVTDMSVGAVARTMLESIAQENDEIYRDIFTGLREGIETSVFNTFEFGRLGPVNAKGTVSVRTAAVGVLIPAGSVVTTPNVATTYVSSTDVVSANSVTLGYPVAVVPVGASTPGALGNQPAGIAFTIATSTNQAIAGVVSVVGGTLSGGSDLETDDQRKARFASYVQTLSRATPLALESAAKLAVLTLNGVETERVRAARCVEPYLTDNTQPIALTLMYVHNGVGGTSGALVAEAQRRINGFVDATGAKVQGYKAAGIPVPVAVAPETLVSTGMTLTLKPGFTAAVVAPAVVAALQRYAQSLDLGVSWLYAEAIARVKRMPGVANVVFTSGPTADVATGVAWGKIMPGAITATVP